ncbi:LSU ribosomal protein L37AE [Staphylothermus marinus F1]|uniref:Large ribosomal subunit protein eL43 n=1 Tax=Staphylothermus marinus (strain ATCC 43588 / DSM 3639 / JCM 9404 / F1) TaxID=399550 RepID=A3DMV1_STAMF|nr:50S ribosomal protein L37ae [Staphylothermus marinus]ABN69961.1 LSU ribosomal protein L37AE [Staphylothermus marinus F1]
MARRTKAVGIAGRYGARYGSTLRKKVRDILEKRYAPHTCPFCGAKGTVKRLSTGIWYCRKCGNKWAGGAYVPRTELSRYFGKYIIRE